MKKLFVACALTGMLASCGSVLTLNEAYMNPAAGTGEATPVETPTQPEAPAASESNTGGALLGSLLGSLAGNAASQANDDGTALSAGGVVSGLLGSVLNAFATVDKNSIVGTWNFKGSAFVFESENVLANLGSDALATQFETKVDQYLAKYNIKEGACSITFEKDGTYVFVAGDRYVNGTYELNTDTKELKMTFGMFATTAYLVYDAGTINLVYESDALLNTLKAIGSKSNNATFALLNTMLNQYDGLRIGIAFAK
ncbi:MAG: DUF4923 family protein [Bacteroidaceae bacterium]|nr:DUF4923 family protein [Bacteroidaceae bacterium]